MFTRLVVRSKSSCVCAPTTRVQCRSYRTTKFVLSDPKHSGDHGHGDVKQTDVNVENGALARTDKMKQPLPDDLKELDKRFDEIFQIAPEDEDRGHERHERLTRQKMHRTPRFTGDFHSLEENHILYGNRGTPANPVLIESVYPLRVVGCTGSSETSVHDLLWHNVKREKPCVCLECGQVFQLVTPPGEELMDFEAH